MPGQFVCFECNVAYWRHQVKSDYDKKTKQVTLRCPKCNTALVEE